MIGLAAATKHSQNTEVSQEGTKAIIDFDADDMRNGGVNWYGHMSLTNFGYTIKYPEQFYVLMPETDKIYFNAVVPSKGLLGQTITLKGCGWVPLEDIKVYFSGKDGDDVEGEIVSKTVDEIKVKVPKNAKSGLVYVKVGEKETITRLFEVVPFGLFSASKDTLENGTEFGLEGEGLSSTKYVYFIDRNGDEWKGEASNITDTGMWVKTPNVIPVGPVYLYVELADGTKSNKLMFKKIPKRPTATPISGTIGKGLTVTLEQDKDLDIYYRTDKSVAGSEQKYESPITLTLDDLVSEDLTLYAFARETINGVNYDSEVAEFYYYPCDEGYELNSQKECIEKIELYKCPLTEEEIKNNISNQVYTDFYYNGYSFYELVARIGRGYGGYQDSTQCFYFSSGQLEEEEYIRNYKFNGINKRYYESGVLREIILYLNGQENAIMKEYDDSGELWRETPYTEGMIDGIRKIYYPSGNISWEVPYTQDKKNGIEKTYWESGQLYYELLYVDDKPTGVEKYYYESGQLHSEMPYIDGKKNGVYKVYHESGELKEEIPFIDGKRNGVEKDYYKSGQCWSETPYIDDKINGVKKNYSESGQLTCESSYVNGMRDGSTKCYTNGCLRYTATYSNGSIVSSEHYDCDL
jgi:antitoxin component YwqK of YwqJK toxin-antitoxin module